MQAQTTSDQSSWGRSMMVSGVITVTLYVLSYIF